MIKTQLLYSRFRSKEEEFLLTPNAVEASTKLSPANFWVVASSNLLDGTGCCYFRIMCVEWIGQGGAGRRNKAVKFIRRKERNRQRHEVREAYVWLKTY